MVGNDAVLAVCAAREADGRRAEAAFPTYAYCNAALHCRGRSLIAAEGTLLGCPYTLSVRVQLLWLPLPLSLSVSVSVTTPRPALWPARAA